MLIVTINEVPGKKMEALGVVRGSTVQSRNLGHDIMAGFRTLWAAKSPTMPRCSPKPGRSPLAAWSRTPKSWARMLWSECGMRPPASCRAQQKSLRMERR